jgi:hypothetical protein
MIGSVAAGCVNKEQLVVWRAAVTSPDGRWTSIAETVQNGGFGSADVETTVYLDAAGSRGNPYPVLGLNSNSPVPHPYVLDNVANRGGTVGLNMNWINPSHLVVTYSGTPTIDLETIKFSTVVITVNHVPERSSGRT